MTDFAESTSPGDWDGEAENPPPVPGVECGWSPTNFHEPGQGRDREECRHCDAPVFRPSAIADGPGSYEVVVEARVTVTAGSRRFAHLRAEQLIGSAFIAGEPSDGRVRVTGSRKLDGPEFAE